VVVGPTGAGKTALGLRLAERTGAEIVSADSQQVYVGMNIGTGKATPAERARIAHHLIDVVRPDADMTAARFSALADAAIAAIAARGKRVVIVGGTGLYVRALLYGLFHGPAADTELRAELAAEVAARGDARGLWDRLRAADPAAAARIDPGDARRIIRALEVLALTGVPMSEHQRRHDHRRVPPRYRAHMVGLAPARQDLYRRIDARVLAMIEAGWVDEVAALRRAGYGPELRSQQAIGYAELHAVLAGTLPLAEAVPLIQRNTRRYARRQLGWYRADSAITWYVSPLAVPDEAIDAALSAAVLLPGPGSD
jgi:tRNA dimethylallyltransferase